MEKKELRKEIKNRFRLLEREKFAEKSAAVLEKLKKLPQWHRAETVFAFISMKDEIDTEAILTEILASGKKLAVPRIDGENLVFHLIESITEGLVPDCYGIPEPEASAPVAIPAGNDMMLIPGLAFDSRNNRLGRGKGFYDRYLASIPEEVSMIGICYDFQIVDAVPSEPHDKPLDMIICG